MKKFVPSVLVFFALLTTAAAQTRIDIMVVYTTACREYNGSTGGMKAFIESAVASANAAYVNSKVDIQLRLVHTAEVSYTENTDMTKDLYALADWTDGVMDEIHILRSDYGADLVCLMRRGTAGNVGGVAYIMSSPTPTFASPFSVVSDSMAINAYGFAHELGHNMGADHALQDGSGNGAYPYSYGYKFTIGSRKYRTIMSYGPGVLVPYFSNPNVTYLNTRVGFRYLDVGEDNAATLNNTRNAVASIYADASGKPIAQTDLLWQKTDGTVRIWHMDGLYRTGIEDLPGVSAPAGWRCMGVRDLNGDGHPDIMWQNMSDGRIAVWWMNNTTRTSTQVLAGVLAPSGWRCMGVGDFNSDGRPDILWQNTNDGRIAVWFMNGATRLGVQVMSGVLAPSGWRCMGVADLNGDGKTDILWQNVNDGRVAAWWMNGMTRTGSQAYASIGSTLGLTCLAVADFDKDGYHDIMWKEEANGRLWVYCMRGPQYVTGYGYSDIQAEDSSSWSPMARILASEDPGSMTSDVTTETPLTGVTCAEGLGL